jgi:hypothetical protein
MGRWRLRKASLPPASDAVRWRNSLSRWSSLSWAARPAKPNRVGGDDEQRLWAPGPSGKALPWPARPHLYAAFVDEQGRVLDDGSEAVRSGVGRHYSELPGPVSILAGVDPLLGLGQTTEDAGA